MVESTRGSDGAAADNAAARRSSPFNAPNAISLARLGLATAYPFLPPPWRLSVLIVGGLSDWLDGFLARRFKIRTLAGQLLDPIADKAFMLSALLTLTLDGPVQWWQAALVLLRDLCVLVIALIVAAQHQWWAFRQMAAPLIGKVTTVFVYVWLALALWLGTAHDVTWTAFVAAGALSATAAAMYALRAARASRPYAAAVPLRR